MTDEIKPGDIFYRIHDNGGVTIRMVTNTANKTITLLGNISGIAKEIPYIDRIDVVKISDYKKLGSIQDLAVLIKDLDNG